KSYKINPPVPTPKRLITIKSMSNTAQKYNKNRYRESTYSIFTIAQISHTLYAFPESKSS
ncbi:hypothetical protein, partial [Bartonella vinsonii]|uniref:hypothetical protein n=1 Tax=Bartonella vinsonii TaxID=33047 RepID=UPI001AEC26AD